MNKIALFIIGIVYCVSSFAMDMRNSSLDLSLDMVPFWTNFAKYVRLIPEGHRIKGKAPKCKGMDISRQQISFVYKWGAGTMGTGSF